MVKAENIPYLKVTVYSGAVSSEVVVGASELEESEVDDDRLSSWI